MGIEGGYGRVSWGVLGGVVWCGVVWCGVGVGRGGKRALLVKLRAHLRLGSLLLLLVLPFCLGLGLGLA